MVGARAIELLHAASLIHDDIIDSAPDRRGLPSMHVQVGVERALVIGDYLVVRSLSLVAEETGRNRKTMSRVLATIGSYAQQCCRGQVRELERSDEADLEGEYLTVARWKTGSQFAAAAVVGAILGDGADHEINALREYGVNLGVAFQIEDDLADLMRDSLSEPATKSVSHRRRTLPQIYFDRRASPAARAEFHRMAAEDPEPTACTALMRREGVLDAVRAEQASFVEAAVTALEPVRRSDALTVLQALPSHVLLLDRTATG